MYASNGLEDMIRERLVGMSIVAQTEIAELNQILPKNSPDELWLHTIEDVIDHIQVGKGGFGILFNQAGQVLKGPTAFLEGNFQTQAANMQENSGFLEFEFERTDYFAYFFRIQDRNFVMAITANREEVMAPSTAIKWLIFFSVLIFSLLAVFISYSLVKPINRLMNQFVNKLSEHSVQLKAASTQLAKSSENLFDDVTTQSSSLEDTTSSIHDMTQQTKEANKSVDLTSEAMNDVTEIIEQSTKNAESARNVSLEAKNVAEKGVDTMSRIVTSMEEIRDKSKEITIIVELINEITQQTKMLATNAAIEAARAGDQGKGFAVVADQVSQLAENSKNAASQINLLIKQSATEADDGHELAEKGRDTLNEILSKSVQVSELVNQIFEFMSNQAGKVDDVKQLMENLKGITKKEQLSMEQISAALEELDKITQSNASNAEDSSSTANQMNSQVLILKEVVDGIDSVVSARKNTDIVKKTQPPSSLLLSPANERPSS